MSKQSGGMVETFAETDRKTVIWDRDGVSWHEAPIPWRLHRCKPQTQGFVNYFSFYMRCACGAISSDYTHGWRSRNSRRKFKRGVQ